MSVGSYCFCAGGIFQFEIGISYYLPDLFMVIKFFALLHLLCCFLFLILNYCLLSLLQYSLFISLYLVSIDLLAASYFLLFISCPLFVQNVNFVLSLLFVQTVNFLFEKTPRIH